MKFIVFCEYEIILEISYYFMELKLCYFSLILNVNINDLNVFGWVVKLCSGFF